MYICVPISCNVNNFVEITFNKINIFVVKVKCEINVKSCKQLKKFFTYYFNFLSLSYKVAYFKISAIYIYTP